MYTIKDNYLLINHFKNFKPIKSNGINQWPSFLIN